MKYRVEYEFMNTDMETTDGMYHETYLDNNGEGFTLQDAEDVAFELIQSDVGYCRNIHIVEM